MEAFKMKTSYQVYFTTFKVSCRNGSGGYYILLLILYNNIVQLRNYVHRYSSFYHGQGFSFFHSFLLHHVINVRGLLILPPPNFPFSLCYCLFLSEKIDKQISDDPLPTK